MLEGVKAVIFDLDGTVVDSMWLWKSIDIEYLGRFGIDFPEGLQSQLEGKSFSETAEYFKRRFGISEPIEKIKNDWNFMAWDKYANEVKPKEGIMEFLRFLKKMRIPVGMATSNSRELVSLVLHVLDLERYFDSVRTSCEVKNGKPAPDVYDLVARDLGVKHSECLVFEDVIQGIQAGKSAGMKVCAVYDEYSEEYTEEKIRLADYYIRDFTEIPEVFAQENLS